MSSRARIAGGARESEGELRNPLFIPLSNSRGAASTNSVFKIGRLRTETFFFSGASPLSAAQATCFWLRTDPSIMELRQGRVSLVILGKPMVRTPRDLHPKGVHTPKTRSRRSKTRRFYPELFSFCLRFSPSPNKAPLAEVKKTFHRADDKHLASQFRRETTPM